MAPLDQPIIFLATDRPDLARTFYESVLGLEFVADEPAALVFRLGSSPLRIQKVERVQVIPQTVLGWEVAHLNPVMKELRSRGVEFETFEFLTQDDAGVWISPAGTRVAWFRDPCGNLLSLSEPGA